MEPDSPVGSRELIEVLMTLGRLRRTGILTIQNNEQIIGLTFLNGEIVSVDALNESLEEGLGRVLASKGLVSVENFASLVAEHEAGGGRVTDLLVERDYLDREQLVEALALHNYLLCREALGWGTIAFKFYPGSEVAHEEGVRALSVDELLVRAVDELGGVGPLPGPIPGPAAVYERRQGGEGAAAGDELLIGLATAEADDVLDLGERIDGRRSIAELAAETGLSEYEARLSIYLMARAGTVHPAEIVTEELLPGAGRQSTAKVATAGVSIAQAGARWFGRDRAAKRSAGESRSSWRSKVDWVAWPTRCLGLGTFILLVALAWSDPGRFLLPFPWQESLRRAVLDEQTSAAYLKIDRAVKTAFLLDGQFPAALGELTSDGFLTQRDLVDPIGRRLGYASQVAGYLIYLEDEGDVAPGTSRTETVTGNFLLDPEFVPERTVELPPLVLLD